jgi:hypothetical protein
MTQQSPFQGYRPGPPKTGYPLGTAASGTKDINANFSHLTINVTGNHTWTFSNFEANKEASLDIWVDGGGTPTITLPTTANIASDSAQTLSSMADGHYLAEIVRFDAVLKFDAGANEIVVGDVLTGATTGHTGVVTEVVVGSGTWGGNDADGFVRMSSVTGAFQNNENLTSTRITPTVHAVADGTAVEYTILVGKVE